MIRKLLPILGVTFIDIVGFSMLIPMLPYFVTHFGMSAFVVGLLFATFSACQLASSAPCGSYISDTNRAQDGADCQPDRRDHRLGAARRCA